MRRSRDRLDDILEAILRIQSRQPPDKSLFLKDELLQIWMVHYLMIIGEAVRSLDPAFKQKYPSVPWRQISGMRNILVHDYFRINQEIVWETIVTHINPLREQIEIILSALPGGGTDKEEQ
jgi:uncharacterized protein with HEPN domain